MMAFTASWIPQFQSFISRPLHRYGHGGFIGHFIMYLISIISQFLGFLLDVKVIVNSMHFHCINTDKD